MSCLPASKIIYAATRRELLKIILHDILKPLKTNAFMHKVAKIIFLLFSAIITFILIFILYLIITDPIFFEEIL